MAKIFRYDIPPNSWSGKVIKVIDGDTLKIQFDSGDIRNVRMLLINTPEKKEMFGKRAANYTTLVLYEKNIFIEFDKKALDIYGRLLGYVWYEEDYKLYFFNHEIVLNSLARVCYIYSNKKYLNLLLNAETRAKAHKKFIWEKPGYASNLKNKFDLSVYSTKYIK